MGYELVWFENDKTYFMSDSSDEKCEMANKLFAIKDLLSLFGISWYAYRLNSSEESYCTLSDSGKKDFGSVNDFLESKKNILTSIVNNLESVGPIC